MALKGKYKKTVLSRFLRTLKWTLVAIFTKIGVKKCLGGWWVKVMVYKWSSLNEYSKNAIKNNCVAWKRGYVVAAMLSLAQLWSMPAIGISSVKLLWLKYFAYSSLAKTYQEAKVCKKHTDYKKHNDYKIPIPMLGNLNEKKLGKFFFLPKFKVSSHIKSLWVILFGDAVLSSPALIFYSTPALSETVMAYWVLSR